MFNMFTLAQGRLVQQEIESPAMLADAQPVWVDLELHMPVEKGWIAAHFGLTIPDNIVDDDLEESARATRDRPTPAGHLPAARGSRSLAVPAGPGPA